jgi:SAM-dependent methyltransferase
MATTTTGSSEVQGRLWSSRPDDWATIMEPIAARPVYEHVLERLAVGSNVKALDVGCGSGVFVELAVGRGASANGLDAAPGLVEQARSRVPGADFEVGELEALPYEDDSFDLVTGFNSFQYAANPETALREAARVTKPEGRVVAAVWGDQADCEAADTIAALGSLLPPPPPGAAGPFALSEPGALAQLLRDSGLSPLEEVDVHCPWEFADEETALRGLLASGPAARAIEVAGEDSVRGALRASIQPCRTSSGGYRLENVFRYVIAA